MTEREKELAEIRRSLKELIVKELCLEDVRPEDIKDDEVLFGSDGLGLDSLDAVEIVVLLQRNFGLEVKAIDQSREIFYSIGTIADYILASSNDLS